MSVSEANQTTVASEECSGYVKTQQRAVDPCGQVWPSNFHVVCRNMCANPLDVGAFLRSQGVASGPFNIGSTKRRAYCFIMQNFERKST